MEKKLPQGLPPQVQPKFPAQGIALPGSGMVVGKIKVSQDTSPERAKGQPAIAAAPVRSYDINGGVLGEFVFFRIDILPIYRPMLVIRTNNGGILLSGHVFFDPDDSVYLWPKEKLFNRLSNFDCIRWVTGVQRGNGIGEWSATLKEGK